MAGMNIKIAVPKPIKDKVVNLLKDAAEAFGSEDFEITVTLDPKG